MKKQLLLINSIGMLCILVLLQACLKDTYTRSYTYTYYTPLYKTTQEVRDNIKSNTPQPIERPGKIYIKGQYIFLNEIDKGIHIIDNSNPDKPQNFAFIDVPGNMDLAIKGNTLYADLYTDLVAIDISDPHHAVLKKVVDGIFPRRSYDYLRPDSSKIITSWQKRDTTVTEKFDINAWRRGGQVFYSLDARAAAYSGNSSGPAVSVSPYGVGGSMARFTIASDRLYTAGTSNLDVFNITNSESPVNVNRKNMGWNIETIYPFMNKLFIGSQTGMLIYDISNPDNPSQEGTFSHVRSCDPVIADNQYAYVTLRSGTTCQGFTNQLDVLNLSSLSNPSLLTSYSMTNPRGLAKDGNTLFICDGTAGLKIYNASSPVNLQLVKQIGGMETFDVIAWNNNALVVASDGLYQYDYTDVNNIRLRSKITISK